MPGWLKWAKVGVFFLCLLPFLFLLWGVYTQSLTANPVEYLLHRTGDWTLRFLCLVLAMTPLQRWSGSPIPIRFRRMLGLFAFFYACLHFLVYTVLDLQLDWAHVAEDIAERPFITIGFSAFVLMLPLALTSTRGMMRRLGRNWKRLHRLVYVIAVAGVVHYWWLVKKDIREPLLYAGIVFFLLAVRYLTYVNQKRAKVIYN